MGVHMGIVAAEESRIGARDVYLPHDEPGDGAPLLACHQMENGRCWWKWTRITSGCLAAWFPWMAVRRAGM